MAIAPATAQDSVVIKSLNERELVDVVVIAPFKDTRSSTTKLVAAFDAAFREKTGLRAEAKERDAKVYGGGNLASIVRAVRSDLDVNAFALIDDDKKRDVGAYNRNRRDAHEPDAHYVLVLTVVAQGEKNRITPTLIDADEALRNLVEFVRDNPPRGGAATDEAKDREEEVISRSALVARMEPILLPATGEIDTAALEQACRRVVNLIQPQLEAQRVWKSLGAFELTSNVVGAEINIEFAAGTEKTVPGVLRFVDVAPGTRHIRLSLPGYETLDLKVDVGTTDIVRVDASMAATQSTAKFLRTSTFIGGATSAVLGAVFLAVGLGATFSQSHSECLLIQNPKSNCGQPEWYRFGSPAVTTDATGAISLFNHGGNGTFPIPPVPFGYSLLGAGVSTMAGSAWIGGEDDLPWPAWLIGAGIFTASYVLSTALEGHMHSEPENLGKTAAGLGHR
ncbi:MAG: hypothetical protein U1E65_35385 [Myxococcota bacterium]